LCKRLLLGNLVVSLFKLFIGNILVIFVFNQLLKLSYWILSGLDGLIRMYRMSSWIVLFDHRPFCGDWSVRCRDLLCVFGIDMLTLSSWEILVEFISNCLYKLLSGNFHSNNWRKCMHAMSCGVLLCDDRTFSSDWVMPYGNLPALDGVDCLLGMSFGFVLFDYRSFCGD